MKKLLTLLSLTMAMTAFGAAPQGNNEESATMKINATVIEPLTVEVKEEMNFGRVIQGTTAIAKGQYSVKGEKGQPIIVTLQKPENLTNGVTKSYLPITFEYTLPTQTDSVTGNADFDIDGKIITNTSHSGEYTGQIIATIKYQ